MHLDWVIVNELKEIMEDEFPMLLDTYINDGSQWINSIYDSISNKDPVALNKCAHSLKGSSANVGAAMVAEICAELEVLGRKGSTRGADTIWAKLSLEFETVKKEMQILKNPDAKF